MGCEKYAGWLTDCALGQLPPSRASELLAHMHDCAACREALETAQQAAKAADHGMNLLVAGEPSPQFHARLRARIADEATAGSAVMRRLTVATSLALCAALVALASMSYLNRGPRPAPAPHASTVSPGGPVADNVTPPSPVVTVEKNHSKRWQLRRRAPASAVRQVIVEPGQRAALDRYLEALQRYQAAGVRMVARREDADSQLAPQPIEIQPLQIEPIRVPTIQGLGDSWQGF